MLEGPLFPAIVRYTVPVIITSILQLLFTAADLMVVGWFCGSDSVAAVGATNSITYLIINMFIGLSVGAGVTVAHAIGSGNREEVHHTVHTAMLTGLVGGVFLTGVGYVLAEPLLRMMDTPEKLLPLSSLYMEVYFLGMTFTMLYNFSASILRAAGDTKSSLYYLLFSGVINVVLNLIFVTAFGMDVDGVALATIIAQAISAILCIGKLIHRQDDCKLELKKLRIYKPQLMKMIRIGVPAGLQASIFSISNVSIQSAVNSFGDVFVAGNSAATSIEGFMYVTLTSFHQTAVNFVGQNVGAHQYNRARKVTGLCLLCVTVTGMAVGGLVYCFGPNLLSLYIQDSPEAIAYGMMRLGVVCIPYFFTGLQDIFTGILRGYGESVAPMVISILGICGIRVGWIHTVFAMPRFHTPRWLYLSFPISWVVTFGIQLVYYRLMMKKLRRSGVLDDEIVGR